jgi:hypothetical protein
MPQSKIKLIAFLFFLAMIALLVIPYYRDVSNHRQRLFEQPASEITEIRFLVDPYYKSGYKNGSTTDAATINEIMSALRTAQKYKPQHPSTKWSCTMIISDARGSSYVRILVTPTNATILYYQTGPDGGFNFDTRESSQILFILHRVLPSDKKQ